MSRRRRDTERWIDFPPQWPEPAGDDADRRPEPGPEVVLTTAIPRAGRGPRPKVLRIVSAPRRR